VIAEAAQKALKDPSKLTVDEKETLLTSRLGNYFPSDVFDNVRGDLWARIASCVDGNPNKVPKWFKISIRLVTILI